MSERLTMQRHLDGQWIFSFDGTKGGSIEGRTVIEDTFGGGEEDGRARKSRALAQMRELIAELNFELNRESDATWP